LYVIRNIKKYAYAVYSLSSFEFISDKTLLELCVVYSRVHTIWDWWNWWSARGLFKGAD